MNNLDSLNRCLEAFKAHHGERGWKMEQRHNPSGFIEFISPDTDGRWTGW